MPPHEAGARSSHRSTGQPDRHQTAKTLGTLIPIRGELTSPYAPNAY